MKSKSNKFEEYKQGTRVMIKDTGEHGEIWESFLGFCSVFIDGEKKCRYFELDEVIFLEDEKHT